MRLPFTEKFLWDLYNFAEGVNRVYTTLASPRTLREVLYSDLIRFRKEYERKNARTSFRQFLHYLQKRGYIKISPTIHGKGVLLTRKGEEKVFKVRYKYQERERRKDGKVQMIIFDIPEKQRAKRQALRLELAAAGYRQLQKSVWYGERPLPPEILELVDVLGIGSFVHIFSVRERGTLGKINFNNI